MSSISIAEVEELEACRETLQPMIDEQQHRESIKELIEKTRKMR